MRKLKLILEYDEAEDPFEGCNWKHVSFNTKHTAFVNPEEYLNPPNVHGEVEGVFGFNNKLKAGTAFILSCYQHGGISWSLMGGGMQCRFDTAQVAGLMIWEWRPKDLGKDYPEREKRVVDAIETLNQYHNGQVFYYRLQEGTTCSSCDHVDYEDVEGCGGFYGTDSMISHVADLIEEGDEVIIEGEASSCITIGQLWEARINAVV